MFEYSSDQEWNQTLNDAYIYQKGLKDIYLNGVNRNCLLFLPDILHITFWFFFFVNKCKNMKRMNEIWNYDFHEYYYVYGVLYSRLESK